jgi:hypothetical protein
VVHFATLDEGLEGYRNTGTHQHQPNQEQHSQV